MVGSASRLAARSRKSMLGLVGAGVVAMPLLMAVPAANAESVSASHVAAAPAWSLASGGRAMTAWTVSDPAALVAVAQRDHVARILAWTPAGFSKVPSTLANLSALVSLAAKAGIQVDALGGDPSWTTSPDAGAAWAAEVAQSGLFERIHLNLDPENLRAWGSDVPAEGAALLTATHEVVRAAGGVPVDEDIPSWFWQVSAGNAVTLDQAVMLETASTTVLADGRSVSAIEADAATEVRHAAALGRPVKVGLELANPPEGAGLSADLYGLSAIQVTAVVGGVEAGERSVHGFNGVSLDDASALQALGGSLGAPGVVPVAVIAAHVSATSVRAGQLVRFTGVVPVSARHGLVYLQVQGARGWTSVGRATLDGQGRFQVGVRLVKGVHRYRLVASGGQLEGVSATLTVTVR